MKMIQNILQLQQFIFENKDWENLLSQKPYCLIINRDSFNGKDLIIFKYNQIESDFNIDLVRECRGLILDANTFEIVCAPFFKFGNYGESYCPKINWSNCFVGQKLDGSLIKIVKYNGKLLISTNGTINAFNAPILEQIGCRAKSFGELVLLGLEYYDLSLDKLYNLLDENVTYMFELTSPFNKVVVQWYETKLHFLGCRDNISLQESYFVNHKLAKVFDIPKIYSLSSIEDCIKASNELGVDEEGYVVCDDKFNRIKIKSPTYVQLHHMKNNGELSYERGIEIIRGNELAEVLTYFPEFKDHLLEIKDKYDALIKDLNSAIDKFNNIRLNGDCDNWSRKDYAMYILSNFKISSVGFMLLDGRIKSIQDWVENASPSYLVNILNLKN